MRQVGRTVDFDGASSLLHFASNARKITHVRAKQHRLFANAPALKRCALRHRPDCRRRRQYRRRQKSGNSLDGDRAAGCLFQSIGPARPHTFAENRTGCSATTSPHRRNVRDGAARSPSKATESGRERRERLEQNLFLAAMVLPATSKYRSGSRAALKVPNCSAVGPSGKLRYPLPRFFHPRQAPGAAPRPRSTACQKCETSKNPAEKGTPARISRKCLADSRPLKSSVGIPRRNDSRKRLGQISVSMNTSSTG